MRTVLRCFSLIEAESAAVELRTHGVLARVLGHLDPLAGVSPYRGEVAPFCVVIADPADEADAHAILASRVAPDDEDWEDQITPDLRKLDPALAPACPGCGQLLSLATGSDRCPACAQRVDLVALVIAAHGPDALAGCCDAGEAVEDLPGILLDQAPVPCPGCGSGLRGLGRVGSCPKCGEPYDKKALIRAFLDR